MAGSAMTYAYVLLSDQDGRFYIGSTEDLRARFAEAQLRRGTFHGLSPALAIDLL
jgi:predicted GIY-YIG superfamily endonuclease